MKREKEKGEKKQGVEGLEENDLIENGEKKEEVDGEEMEEEEREGG